MNNISIQAERIIEKLKDIIASQAQAIATQGAYIEELEARLAQQNEQEG